MTDRRIISSYTFGPSKGAENRDPASQKRGRHAFPALATIGVVSVATLSFMAAADQLERFAPAARSTPPAGVTGNRGAEAVLPPRDTGPSTVGFSLNMDPVGTFEIPTLAPTKIKDRPPEPLRAYANAAPAPAPDRSERLPRESSFESEVRRPGDELPSVAFVGADLEQSLKSAGELNELGLGYSAGVSEVQAVAVDQVVAGETGDYVAGREYPGNFANTPGQGLGSESSPSGAELEIFPGPADQLAFASAESAEVARSNEKISVIDDQEEAVPDSIGSSLASAAVPDSPQLAVVAEPSKIRRHIDRIEARHSDVAVAATTSDVIVEVSSEEERGGEDVSVRSSNGEPLGPLSAVILENELVSVRLGDLISLYQDKFERPLFVWLSTSNAASRFVTTETLSAAGLDVRFDPDQRQIVVDVSNEAKR